MRRGTLCRHHKWDWGAKGQVAVTFMSFVFWCAVCKWLWQSSLLYWICCTINNSESFCCSEKGMSCAWLDLYESTEHNFNSVGWHRCHFTLPGKECEIAGAPAPVPCNDTGPDVTIPFSDAKRSKVVLVTCLDGEFAVLWSAREWQRFVSGSASCKWFFRIENRWTYIDW